MSRTGIKWTFIAVAILLAACDYEVSEGSYEGLRIGSTKQEVVEALRSKGVPDLLMIVDRSMNATKSDMEQLPEILKQEGICLNTHRGTLRFGFAANGTLSYIGRADTTAELFPRVRMGMSRDEFSRIAQAAIEAGGETSVFNCVADVDWVEISGDASNVLETLDRFDTWAYWEPNSYSHADLLFTHGRLEKIRYHWRSSEE